MPHVISIERLAKEEGIQEIFSEPIINLLSIRFEAVSPVINDLLNSLDDSATLKQLNIQAATVESMK